MASIHVCSLTNLDEVRGSPDLFGVEDVTSVVLKFKRIHLCRSVGDGYTLRDLQDCFGVDHHLIGRSV